MTGRTGSSVELRNVVRDFGNHVGLDGLSLSAEPGEFIALLGPSGCGKTTALRALAGLERVDSGVVLIDGIDVTDVPTSKRDIGMVFQSYSLFPHLTAGENVEFGLRMRKVEASVRRQRSVDALAMVGLDNHASRYAHQLSGGQQQRVALARALVTQPRVLLLDEPLSALDARVRVQMRGEIRRLQIDLGITTFFVTHDQEEALAMADRVAVMRSGGIDQIGTPEELYKRPLTPFVAEFVGFSNRLDGVVSDGTVLVRGRRLPLIQPETRPGPVQVYLRPEDVRIADAGIPATIISSSFLGSLRRTQVRIDDGNGTVISCQHSAHDTPVAGESVFLEFQRTPVSVEVIAAVADGANC